MRGRELTLVIDITYRSDQFPYRNLILLDEKEILFEGKFLPIVLFDKDLYTLNIRVIWKYRNEIYEDEELSNMFAPYGSIIKNLIGRNTHVNVDVYRIDLRENYLFVTRRSI